MKLIYFLALLLCLSSCGGIESGQLKFHAESDVTEYKNGDIIFQNSQSRQCRAIEEATKSKYTHCGIIFLDDHGKPYVMEAVQPVQIISLESFISRGENEHFAIKRLSGDGPTDSQVKTMKSYGLSQMNKNYDIYFNWSDEEIYCSELVWKMYSEAGIKLCDLRKLKDFDLTSDIVKRIMKERYGKEIPYEEKVVAPSDIFDSEMVETVK